MAVNYVGVVSTHWKTPATGKFPKQTFTKCMTFSLLSITLSAHQTSVPLTEKASLAHSLRHPCLYVGREEA